MPFGTSKQFGGDRFGSVGRFGAGRFGEASAATPVIFTVTAGQTVTIGLAVKSGTAAVINWGDGTTSLITNSGSYQNYTRTYATGGTYVGVISNVGVITHLRLGNETKARFDFTRFTALTHLILNNTGSSVTGVITNMALTYLHLSGAGSSVTGVITNMALTSLHLSGTGSSVTGVITNMALTSLHLSGTGSSVTGVITNMALTSLYLSGTGSSVTGVITNMPLTYLVLYGTGASVTGVITNMALTYLRLDGTGSSVTGVITNMALTYLVLYGTGSSVTGELKSTSRLTREFIDITGEITLPTNRVYGTWGSDSMRIDMDARKLTAAETDATLIRLAAATISGSNKTVYIYGQARTSASDAAMTTLNNAGVTVTITG